MNAYGPKPISIASNTLVKIGPLWTKNKDYITQNMSGSEVKVRCFGKILGQGSGCCIVGTKDCPPKSGTQDKKDDKKKSKQKAPAKNSPATKQPEKALDTGMRK
jgi:hypothetical protein